jgi:hypothetical protein
MEDETNSLRVSQRFIVVKAVPVSQRRLSSAVVATISLTRVTFLAQCPRQPTNQAVSRIDRASRGVPLRGFDVCRLLSTCPHRLLVARRPNTSNVLRERCGFRTDRASRGRPLRCFDVHRITQAF